MSHMRGAASHIFATSIALAFRFLWLLLRIFRLAAGLKILSIFSPRFALVSSRYCEMPYWVQTAITQNKLGHFPLL